VSTIAPLLESFFTERLAAQRQASPNTIAAYRDTWCQVLRYAQARTGKTPSSLTLDDIDAPFVGDFLNHLEHERGVSVGTRNNRLTAIRALFNHAAYRHPEHAASIQRVLAIPAKRTAKAIVTYLDDNEMRALLDASDRASRIGRRDHAILVVALETGMRVSELTGLTCSDVRLGTGAHVRCHGKGRKERVTPLRRDARAVIVDWLTERNGQPDEPLFPGPAGRRLSRDAVRRLVERHIVTAAKNCPSLRTKSVTPHTLRHSCAMNLLRSGIDPATIALILGHEDVRTTYGVYLHADLTLKEKAIARTAPIGTRPGRYRPPDTLLAYLESL